jgi:hypothetical protein
MSDKLEKIGSFFERILTNKTFEEVSARKDCGEASRTGNGTTLQGEGVQAETIDEKNDIR